MSTVETSDGRPADGATARKPHQPTDPPPGPQLVPPFGQDGEKPPAPTPSSAPAPAAPPGSANTAEPSPPTSGMTIRVDAGFKESVLNKVEVNGLKATFTADKHIADFIEVDLKHYADEVADTTCHRNFCSRVFHRPFVSSGLLVVQFPNEEVLGAVRSAALAATRGECVPAAQVHRIEVSFREERPNWIGPTVDKIMKEMTDKHAVIGVCHPPSGSLLHEDFMRSYDHIRHLHQSFRQANRLLIVFLPQRSASDRVAGLPRESDLWFVVSPETALAAMLDRDDAWIEQVKSLVGAGAGAKLSYADLRNACEAALKFENLVQFGETLRDDADRAAKAFDGLISQLHSRSAAGVFDLIAAFLAAHIPGLGISDFGKLASRVLGTLPPPSAPSDSAAKPAAWPQWAPSELRRLRDDRMIEVKGGTDGRRVFCTSPAIAAQLRRAFDDEYFVLAELRQTLLADPLIVEAKLSSDQIALWVALIAAAQHDDAGTDAVRQLAKMFASGGLREKSLKEIGARAAMVIVSFWSAMPGQDDERGPTAEFVRALLAEAGPQLPFQALRFCSRDASNPIGAKALQKWAYRVLKAGYHSIPESLVYAYVRDLLAIVDSGRRELFVSPLLDWIRGEHEPEGLRKVLRDSVANALWASVAAAAEGSPAVLTIEELPIVGGLTSATCANLLTLLADADVRVIDANIRRSFAGASIVDGDAQRLDWLDIPAGLILASVLAEWRVRLGTDDAARGEAWLKTLIKPVRESREQRRYLYLCATYLIDFFRFCKANERDREEQQTYTKLIGQLSWVRSELRPEQ
jgi:hypothetical protein